MDLLDVLRREMLAPNPLLQTGDHILVAVSGGPDSLALLHALSALRVEIGLQGLSAGHFHHGLRGQEADDDAAFVADFCAAQSISCVVERGDVGTDAARAHISIQQAARTARYAFFARAAHQCGAGKVATAHTQDDQVETVLLHILRGTGLDGLRGIPARRGIYVRPLLGVSHAQVEQYCAAHALHPRRDTSNTDPSHYLRNRLRLELVPLLERDYAPGVRGALLRLSEIARADADFLHAHAEAALREAILDETSTPPGLTLSRAALAALHPGLLPHVLRAALIRVRGTAEGITHRHLTQAADALRGPAQARWGMTTPAPRCRLMVRAHALVLAVGDDETPALPPSLAAPLPVGGGIAWHGAEWHVQAELEDRPPAPPFLRQRLRNSPQQAVFDAAHIHLPSLHVRAWQPGDRIAPRGMAGHAKKVQDVFTDAKVPRRERPHVPIVADRDGVLWVAGLTSSERGHLTQATQQCLVLTAFFAPSRNSGRQAGKGQGRRE